MMIPGFLRSQCSELLENVAEAVVFAGSKVCSLPRAAVVKAGEGHRSVVTEGDEASQKILLDRLSLLYPKAKFLCEEDSEHPAMLSKYDPRGLFYTDLVFIVDSLDSTARYGANIGGWSVVVGIMQRSHITGSVVYAPALNGGLLVVAEDKRLALAEWDGEGGFCSLGVRGPTASSSSVVLLGVDALLYPTITVFVPEVAANVRAVFTSGSGALGLALVACGRAQAIIQTPQKAWDWAGAYRAVLEGGGVFLFFRITQDGILAPLNSYNHEAFCYLPKTNRLGFVAGEPALACKLFDLLPKTNWARTNPDTVTGAWK